MILKMGKCCTRNHTSDTCLEKVYNYSGLEFHDYKGSSVLFMKNIQLLQQRP